MEISRIEFNDPDDPISNDGKIRFTFAPEAMALALPNGKQLTHDDQQILGSIIRLAYAQGKAIGRAMDRPPTH